MRDNKFIRKYSSTIIIIFLLFWLYLKSPFNQKLIDPKISIEEFEYISTVFWISLMWVIFFLSGFFFLQKGHLKKYFTPFILWNSIFFLLSYTYNIGLDITDEGWQLSKSWWFIHGSNTNNSDLIWGSSLLSGLWMTIPSKISVLWSRIGFLIFFPFFSTILFYIFKKYYSNRSIFIAIMISFLFFYRNFLIYSYINYYYLPVFFILLSILYILKFEDNPKFKYLILSGALAGISIHLKFTFILVIPLYAIYLFIFNGNKLNKKRSIIFYYSAFFAMIGIGFIFLSISGADTLIDKNSRLSIINMFSTFFGNKKINSNLNYSLFHLAYVYSKDIGVIILHTIAPIILLIIGAFFSKKYAFIKYFSWIIIGILLLVYKEQTNNNFLLVISIFLAIDIILAFSNNVKNKEFLRLNYLLIYLFFVSFLGSGMSFYAGLISGGLFGLSSFLIVSLLSYRSKKMEFKILAYSLLVFILFIQFKKEFVAYRDIETKYLNTMFKSEELIGIYSFNERVEVVDDFIKNAKNIISTKDKVFIVGMPMFYYILNIEPIVSEPYDLILGLDQLKSEINQQRPNVIIVSVQSPRGIYWPLERNRSFGLEDNFEISTRKYYEFYGRYISENGFKKVFSNIMFDIYKKEHQ